MTYKELICLSKRLKIPGTLAHDRVWKWERGGIVLPRGNDSGGVSAGHDHRANLLTRTQGLRRCEDKAELAMKGSGEGAESAC